eukprot:299588_1
MTEQTINELKEVKKQLTENGIIIAKQEKALIETRKMIQTHKLQESLEEEKLAMQQQIKQLNDMRKDISSKEKDGYAEIARQRQQLEDDRKMFLETQDKLKQKRMSDEFGNIASMLVAKQQQRAQDVTLQEHNDIETILYNYLLNSFVFDKTMIVESDILCVHLRDIAAIDLSVNSIWNFTLLTTVVKKIFGEQVQNQWGFQLRTTALMGAPPMGAPPTLGTPPLGSSAPLPNAAPAPLTVHAPAPIPNTSAPPMPTPLPGAKASAPGSRAPAPIAAPLPRSRAPAPMAAPLPGFAPAPVPMGAPAPAPLPGFTAPSPLPMGTPAPAPMAAPLPG